MANRSCTNDGKQVGVYVGNYFPIKRKDEKSQL
jgi:hypothetical protein